MSNGYANEGESVLVMYKVVNSETDSEGDNFNAFHMPRGGGMTLAEVKQHCSALRALNHIGPDGYHWRVCVEDKPVPGSSSSGRTFSWWDIQDEKASLPVKIASPLELQRLFTGTSSSNDGGADMHSTPSAKSAAKGALKGLGKAMSVVAGAVDGHHDDNGPKVSVIAFKLLDLVKMHDDFVRIHGGSSRGGHIHHAEPAAPKAAPRTAPHPAATASPAPQRAAPTRPTPQPHGRTPARTPAPPPRSAARAPAPPPQAQAPRRPQQQEASLMDFDSPKTSRQAMHHAKSMPSAFDNETRAERLKREYAQEQMKQERVWDEVDQRWVAVDSNGGGFKTSMSAPPSALNGNSNGEKKVVGIKLDASNAIGKSADVQAAVHQRVSEMRAAQDKAVAEIRAREDRKKKDEDEEDAVRRRLEPKIKLWSEEHGQKKQLRALLGTLHTILWPGADWKPVSIGDLLDDSKVKKCFHKASRVVHPDKTHHLGAEERFLAKRIFDSLSQAKTEFDEQSAK